MQYCSVLALLLLAALGACSSVGSLDYAPTVAIIPGPSGVISGVSAIDRRDEKPNRFATVRSGYGSPMYVADTKRTVAEEVADAFAKGLKDRGMLAPSGNAPYRIALVLRTFYGNQYYSRHAHIDIDTQVLGRSGGLIYEDSVKDARDQGNFFGTDIADLETLVNSLLDSTIDRMLDKPAFRAALAQTGRGAPGG